MKCNIFIRNIMMCSPAKFIQILFISVWSFLIFSSICLVFVWIVLSNKYKLQPIANYCGLAGALGIIMSLILCMMNDMILNKFCSRSENNTSLYCESERESERESDRHIDIIRISERIRDFSETTDTSINYPEAIVIVSHNKVIPIIYDIENNKKDITQDNIPIAYTVPIV